MTINKLIEEIASGGTIYNDIIDNILTPNHHLKNELLSELTIAFYDNEERVLDAYENGYFKYYFIRTVKNQIQSSTSSFHKNCRQTVTTKLAPKMDDILHYKITNANDIEHLEDIERMNKDINNARKVIKSSWYEAHLATLYYDEGYTYRQIEAEYGIDHVSAYQTVTKYKNKLIKEINKKNEGRGKI